MVEEKAVGNEARKQQLGGGTQRHHHLRISPSTPRVRPALAMAAAGVSAGRSGGRRKERETPARSPAGLQDLALAMARRAGKFAARGWSQSKLGRRRKRLGTQIAPSCGQEPSAF